MNLNDKLQQTVDLVLAQTIYNAIWSSAQSRKSCKYATMASGDDALR